MTYDYLRQPNAIYRRSFELVEAASDFQALSADVVPVARRLIHACGMPDIVDDLRFTPSAASHARKALDNGAPVLCDARMVAEGIIRATLPSDNPVICSLNDDGVRDEAARRGETRSAVAVERWTPHLAGAVVAIGNAPTALFRLLEMLTDGAPEPAVILAFPVGFVGAAESKQALVDAVDDGLDIPYITLLGRRGGSALAAAAVNAMTGRQQ